MTDIARVRIAISGWGGSPGVITEHYSQGSLGGWDDTAAQDLLDEVYERYLAQASVFIDPMVIEVDPAISIIDVASGDLIDVITAASPGSPISGAGTGTSLSRATMIGVRLLTSDFRNGRRVQGRLFWGPTVSGVFETDGTIKAAEGASIEAEFAASISGLGPRLCVYSRPNPSLNRAGDWADVTTVRVSSKPFVLRSRRD